MADTIAVTPDNRLIVAGWGHTTTHEGCITFWDFDTGSFIRSDRWYYYVLASMIVTPNSRSIVVSGRNDHAFGNGMHYIFVGDIETAQYQVIKKWGHGSLELSFTWDKKHIKFDEFIWDWEMGGEPQHISNRIGRLELTAEQVLLSTDKTFIIKDILTGEITCEFRPGHDNPHHRSSPIKVTPNGRYLLSQKGNYEAKNMILSMWNTHTGKLVKSFKACRGKIKDIDITADGRYAVVLAYDPNSIIRVLDLRTGKLRLSIENID